MSDLYRVILVAEDGTSVLKDGYRSHEKAEYVADRLRPDYGDSQAVYVQPYQPGY